MRQASSRPATFNLTRPLNCCLATHSRDTPAKLLPRATSWLFQSVEASLFAVAFAWPHSDQHMRHINTAVSRRQSQHRTARLRAISAVRRHSMATTAVQHPSAPAHTLTSQPMNSSTDSTLSSAPSSVISLVPYTSPTAGSGGGFGSQFVFTGGNPSGGSGVNSSNVPHHPPGLDTALSAQRMSRKSAAAAGGTAGGSSGDQSMDIQQSQQQQTHSADEAKAQQHSRRGRRGRTGQGRQGQRSSRRGKHSNKQQQHNGANTQPHTTATATEAALTAALLPLTLPLPQPQPQQQTTPNSRSRRRRILQQPANATATNSDGPSQPTPPTVSHRRSTLRSSQRSQAPHTPYNTTAYILAHPPPGARPASSPDRYGADIIDMPEIDQWKGYGSMEKGVQRLKGAEERSGHMEEKSTTTTTNTTTSSSSTSSSRSRRRRRDDPLEDQHSSGKKRDEEQMESDAANADSLQPPQHKQRGRTRTSGGGGGGSSGARGKAAGRGGRGSRGRTINTRGLREEDLRSGEWSPALSGVSGNGSPAHSVVNGDDIERWTRRQRMQRLKAQRREEEAKASERQPDAGGMNGGDDAVMSSQVQHGWMQPVT